MQYFLRSFSPFRWFKKGSCQFLAKECAQYWLAACPVKVWLGKLTALDRSHWADWAVKPQHKKTKIKNKQTKTKKHTKKQNKKKNKQNNKKKNKKQKKQAIHLNLSKGHLG